MNLLYPLILGIGGYTGKVDPDDPTTKITAIVSVAVIAISIIAFVVRDILAQKWKKGVFPPKLTFDSNNKLQAHYALGAYFIQRDRRKVKDKMVYIDQYLKKHFPNDHEKLVPALEWAYDYPIKPQSVATWYKSNRADTKTIEDLVIFILDLALIDGEINNQEYYLLKQVSSILGFIKLNQLIEERIPKQSNSSKQSYSSTSDQRKNALQVLGLELNATASDIKNAYRSLVKQYHPDKHQHASKQMQEESHERFIAVQEAYDYLIDG